MKVGRNDPCPCESGMKYKKCCIDKEVSVNPTLPPEVRLHFEKMQAIQDQIKKQQGLGRPIISTMHQGYRFVASGGRLHYSKKWKTFPDFLFHYIKVVLGAEWGSAEFKKTEKEQHPIIQWHIKAMKYLRSQQKDEVEIYSAPMTGAVFALLNLSYNLFLLEHNVKLQEKIILRLKNREQFYGALYETYVSAVFIRAGFSLELENEDESATSHCEFTATAPITGNKYSVEAKARQPFKSNIGIRRQLGMALSKKADHKRIIFIDVNIPNLMEKMQEVDRELCNLEKCENGEWEKAPPAYVFVTNHSFTYDLEGMQFERIGFAFGFKINYFKADTKYTSLRDMRLARDKHIDMVRLIGSIREHNEIPVTFDGEIPEFAFNDDLRAKRLLIGGKYLIPDQDGKEVVGILESATMIIPEKKVWGAYCLEDSRRIICYTAVSAEEIDAYKKHPDTFFGVPRKQSKKIEDPLEFYDFIYETYKNTPREKLLEFMKDRPDIESLKKLSDEGLRITCCEGWTYGAMQSRTRKT